MPEIIIGIQAALIIGLVVALVSTHARLFRVAMSRTPGEYRAAEKSVRNPVPPPSKTLVEIDEAAQLVLSSMAELPTMPHGLGGE
jgi:hypothetical protein